MSADTKAVKVTKEVDVCEMLIRSIQARPPIWCQHNQRIPGIIKQKQKLWTEVAKNTNFTVEYAKKMWKDLRKGFNRHLKKVPRTKDHKYKYHPQLSKSTWPYYQKMIFLVDPKQVEVSGSQCKKHKLNSNDVGVKKMRIEQNGSFKQKVITSPVEIEVENTVTKNQIQTVNLPKSINSSNSIIDDLSNGDEVLDLSQSEGGYRNEDVNEDNEENEEQEGSVNVGPYTHAQIDTDFHFLMSLYDIRKPLTAVQKMSMRTAICGYVTEQISNIYQNRQNV